jgi:hypothetical protein
VLLEDTEPLYARSVLQTVSEPEPAEAAVSCFVNECRGDPGHEPLLPQPLPERAKTIEIQKACSYRLVVLAERRQLRVDDIAKFGVHAPQSSEVESLEKSKGFLNRLKERLVIGWVEVCIHEDDRASTAGWLVLEYPEHD